MFNFFPGSSVRSINDTTISAFNADLFDQLNIDTKFDGPEADLAKYLQRLAKPPVNTAKGHSQLATFENWQGLALPFDENFEMVVKIVARARMRLDNSPQLTESWLELAGWSPTQSEHLLTKTSITSLCEKKALQAFQILAGSASSDPHSLLRLGKRYAITAKVALRPGFGSEIDPSLLDDFNLMVAHPGSTYSFSHIASPSFSKVNSKFIYKESDPDGRFAFSSAGNSRVLTPGENYTATLRQSGTIGDAQSRNILPVCFAFRINENGTLSISNTAREDNFGPIWLGFVRKS